MPQTKDVSTSSAGTLKVPALTASARMGGLAPALPPGALVGRGVAQTLQQLADAHNAVHGEDRKKRADVRALRAAYRRGAARKPRAGRSRRQEGLARAQAHLAALAGKQLPAEFAADRDMLPGEQKRLAVLTLEGSVAEPLEHLKSVAASVGTELAADDDEPDEPEQESKQEPVATETKVWSDEARAAALAARRAHAMSLPRSKRATSYLPNGALARHSDGSHGVIEHVPVSSLREGDRLIHPTTGEHVGTVTSVTAGGKPVDDKTPLGLDRTVHIDGKLHGTMGPGARYTRFGKEPEPSQGDLPVGALSTIAHAASESAHEPSLTPAERADAHENARGAHIAAASQAKLLGDEAGALEHLSLADHHRDAGERAQAEAGHHSFEEGHMVKRPDGTVGRVMGVGVNGVGVRGSDGKLSIHQAHELIPARYEDRPRTGSITAGDAVPGTHVSWTAPGGPVAGSSMQSHREVGGVLTRVEEHERDPSLVRLHLADGTSHVHGRRTPITAREANE